MSVESRPRIRVAAGSSRLALEASTALSSVQFRGLGARAAAAEDDESEEDMTSAKTSSDDTDARPAKTKKARKAKKSGARDEDPDDDDDEEQDDDDDGDGDREEMRGKSAKAVRLRERARIAVIMEHPSARANIDAALRLALNTSLPATEACAVLDGMPKAAPGTGLADRMAQFGAQRPGAGAAPAPKGQAAIDQSWDAIAARAGVPRRIGAV